MDIKYFPILSLGLAFATSPLYAAEQLDTLTIEDSIQINPNVASPVSGQRSRALNADGGDFLNQINGVSSSRFGGRGLEPVIRGQSQTRLNILLDGAYVHGGCPNRMDPPASWAALETYEQVKVLKGVQSVLYGGGGSGGTVLFERDSRGLAEEEGTHGRLSVTASSNGTKGDLLGDAMWAADKGYIRAITEVKRMDDYEDGDGRTVRSSYDHRQMGLILGFTPTEDRLFELSIENNEFEDALYPGSAMDSPEESGNIARVRFEDKPDLAWLSGIKFEAYLSDIDHLMDNYSLRNAPKYSIPPAMAGKDMLRATPTTSKTIGGRLQLSTDIGATRLQYGIDVQNNNRDGSLNNMDNGTARSVSLMWPDVNIDQIGLFAEANQALAKHQRLKYGMRVDFVDASADKAGVKPATTPNTAKQIYNMYYGTNETDQSETNLGALVRFEQDFGKGYQAGIGISRSVRTADATERYMNKWGMPASKRWVGNPLIKAEKHHQLDLSIGKQGKGFSWNTVVFYDKVSDYILRDGARGQSGVLLSDNAEIYRNVDATLYGAEWEGRWRLDRHWDISTSLAYVRADNDTDDRAIAQTPPLNGQIQLDYHRGHWAAGTRLRFAAAQNRLDELSKQEVSKTAGYGVLDVYGQYRINQTFSLRFGVDNVMDKTYAQHINRANLMDNQALKVNEPGRNAWLRLNAEF